MPSWLKRELSAIAPQNRLWLLVFKSLVLGIIASAVMIEPPTAGADLYVLGGAAGVIGLAWLVLLISVMSELRAKAADATDSHPQP